MKNTVFNANMIFHANSFEISISIYELMSKMSIFHFLFVTKTRVLVDLSHDINLSLFHVTHTFQEFEFLRFNGTNC